MSILDIIVLVAAALAAWTGWRSGGLYTVVGIVGRVVGVAIGLGLADWVAGASWAFPVRVISEIVLVLLGWAVGGRLAQWVSPSTYRPGGRISTVDRALGLGVRAVLTLVVGCLGIQAVSMWGPAAAQAAAADSALPGLVAQVGPVGVPRLGQLAADGRDALPADLDGLLPQTAAVNDHPGAVSSSVSQAVVQVTAPLRSRSCTVGAATVAGGVAMPNPGLSTGHLYLRPGYRLQSEVRPGNSGGPLLDTSGAVIGVIDARSLIDGDVGYAITAEPLLADLAR